MGIPCQFGRLSETHPQEFPLYGETHVRQPRHKIPLIFRHIDDDFTGSPMQDILHRREGIIGMVGMNGADLVPDGSGPSQQPEAAPFIFPAAFRDIPDQIRQKRFDRAEKMANEAPVKMLGPLMLFIFPAVFIVLLGPILSRVAGGMM